jgi:hypothetical protein
MYCLKPIDNTVRRLNGVFLYFVTVYVTNLLPGITYGSLVFTFSPPVSGFSFLTRNFNAQMDFNNSMIIVTTDSGRVTYSVQPQTDGDINFIGWFQQNASVTSVTLTPMAYKFGSSSQFAQQMTIDELRVFTRYTTAAPAPFSTIAPSSKPTTAPSPLPTATPSSFLSFLGNELPTSSSDTATIWIWSGAGSFFVIAIATVYLCRRRCNHQPAEVKYTGVLDAPSAPQRP